MLLHFGVTPYFVFDGDYLPSKSSTEEHRHVRREESRKLGMELLNLGRTSQAHKELQKAVDITPEMAGLLIQELAKADIPYIVAPYEADSQLVYLEQNGYVEAILSEDSDLLVFGAKCLLTKLDQYGECIMIRRDDFTACREVSFVGWSDEDFRRMAILSGCDYLANMPKMGLKTAHSLLRKYKTIERVIQAVQYEGKMKVPDNYMVDFLRAEMTFRYQWVFCPTKKTLVTLTKAESCVKLDEMPYIGEFVEQKVAIGVAKGLLHPHTKVALRLPRTDPTKPLSRPALRNSQSAPIIDDKKNTSIDSFFKPKRTPLAELNPNSFIMTPRQEELARRASTATWSSPTAPLNENTAPRTAPRTAPAASQRPVPNHVDMETPSVSRVKRQRLCYDDPAAPATPTIRVVSGKSQFFSLKKPKDRRRSEDFGIYSDDSTEEAMLALPDPSEAVVAEVRLTISTTTENKLEDKSEEHGDEDESLITLAGQSPVPEEGESIDWSESTFVEDAPGKVTPGLFDEFLLGEVKIMRRKCSIESPASPSSRAPLPQSVPQATQIQSQPSPSSLPRQTKNTEVPDIEDSAWSAAEAKIIVPASDIAETLKSIPSGTSLLLGTLCGSEDLLASESDGGDEVESPLKSKALDLGRFSFIRE
jgi:exonuclease-1